MSKQYEKLSKRITENPTERKFAIKFRVCEPATRKRREHLKRRVERKVAREVFPRVNFQRSGRKYIRYRLLDSAGKTEGECVCSHGGEVFISKRTRY